MWLGSDRTPTRFPRALATTLALLASPTATAATAATLHLPDAPITPGRYATVEIRDLPPGDATLVGGHAVTTMWPHAGGRVAVPVLAPSDLTSPWTLTLNDEPHHLDVPQIDPPAAVSAIQPRPYDAIAGWQPARPAGERLGVVLFAIAALAIVVATSRRRRWIGLAVAVATVGGLLAFALNRDAVIVRRAVLSAGDGVGDEWLFLRPAGTARATTVAIDGLALPIGYSAEHLARLSPTLRCDARGEPIALSLTLPPDGVAIAVRRVAVETPPDVPPWSRPLQSLYRNRP